MVQMSAVIEVTDARLVAGRASLPASAIDSVTALAAEAARRKRGTEADPRAFVLLRGWVTGAVVVTLDDRDDPTPYWFISSRRPEVLASTLNAVTGRTN